MKRGSGTGEGKGRIQELPGDRFRVLGLALHNLFQMDEALQVHGQKVDGRLILSGPHYSPFDDRLNIGG